MENIWANYLKDGNYYYSTKHETNRFLQFVMRGRKFLVFDVETTGKSKNADYVVEFSAFVMEKIGKYYEETETVEWLIKPPFRMGQDVIDVHHISNEMLEDKPTERQVFPEIDEFLSRNSDAVLIGYNVNFDIGFLQRMANRNHAQFDLHMMDDANVIDVFNMVKENVFKDETDGHRRLCDIATLLLPGRGFTFHDSSEDIKATWEVGVELVKRYWSSGMKPESAKPKCRVISYNFKKYGPQGHLFVTVAANGGFYSLDYNTYNKCWAHKTTDVTPAFEFINMDDLENQLNQIAAAKGKKGFWLLKDKADLRRRAG